MPNALRLVAASGICAAVLAACGGVNTQTGATSSPTPTATPSPEPTGTATPEESPSPTATATATATATPTGTSTATPSPTPASASLHLAEVFYDPSGTDDGLEWVLLANDTDSPIDLSTYTLGSGRTAWTYTTAALSGTIAAHGCFLVGGPTSSAANGSPVYSQSFHFSPNLPNPASNGATGVGLFQGTITASSLPLDYVVYGGTNNGLNGTDGTTHAPNLPDTGGMAAHRNADGSWSAAAPAPNTCPAL